MSDNDVHQSRLITIHVNPNGVSDMDLQHLFDRIIDIEMTEQDAKKLKDMLERKLSTEIYGTVTFRLRGRIII